MRTPVAPLAVSVPNKLDVYSITTTFIVTINNLNPKQPVVKGQPPWVPFWSQFRQENGLAHRPKRRGHHSKRTRRDENESMGRAYGRGVGFYLGEPCDDRCNGILVHVYCNTTTKQCECKQDYPVKIQNRKCAKAARLNENCEHTESCTYFDEHAVCSTDDGKCRCTTNYIIKPGSENTEAVCIQGNNTGFMDNSDMTTMISVIAGLMIFTALFCLVLRLFSRARFNRPRDRIGNASAPSVVLTGLETSGGAPNSASSSRRASRSSGSNQDPYKNRRHSCSAATLAPPSLSGFSSGRFVHRSRNNVNTSDSPIPPSPPIKRTDL